MLTDSEIIEMEQLIKAVELDERMRILQFPTKEKANPNYIFLQEAIKNQKYNSKDELTAGYRGCTLEGSSRSGKSWAGVYIIIWICLFYDKNCDINIYRETFKSFETTLYDDFKKALDLFELPNPFYDAKEVELLRIGKCRIRFIGCNNVGVSHGAGCDYAFFNEMMFIPEKIFNQSEMRCRKFWWCDYNPSFTEHYVFNTIIPRYDVGFLRTTFNQNPFITQQEKSKILGYEPWESGSYEIRNEKDLYYNEEPISEKNQPPPHPTNIKNGTADVFHWMVYGLGLRGAMTGVIFNNVVWITPNEKPDWQPVQTLDFGFTNDPTAATNYWEDTNNIWIEPLLYQSYDNVEDLDIACKEIGFKKYLPTICDSSDKYTGEGKGTVRMVAGLQDKGWQASKISKTKSVAFWIGSMKKKKVHIVINGMYKHAKKEQENYKWKEINGIAINQPEDAFNHIWDSSRYGHMCYNLNIMQQLTTHWS